jgi:hypothetical protein
MIRMLYSHLHPAFRRGRLHTEADTEYPLIFEATETSSLWMAPNITSDYSTAHEVFLVVIDITSRSPPASHYLLLVQK